MVVLLLKNTKKRAKNQGMHLSNCKQKSGNWLTTRLDNLSWKNPACSDQSLAAEW